MLRSLVGSEMCIRDRFTGTPRGYGNWSYELFLKGKNDPEWESFQFTTLEGGMVSKEELEQAKQDIDIRTFRQEFEGTFENYAGAVYYNFHPVESVVKKEIDWKKPLHIGMDFNVDPMSACVAQIDKDIIYVVDEIVIYGSNTDEMCQEIKDRYGTKIPIIIYPDPACRQRKTSAGGKTDLSILQNAGFQVKAKFKHSAIRDALNEPLVPPFGFGPGGSGGEIPASTGYRRAIKQRDKKGRYTGKVTYDYNVRKGDKGAKFFKTDGFVAGQYGGLGPEPLGIPKSFVKSEAGFDAQINSYKDLLKDLVLFLMTMMF